MTANKRIALNIVATYGRSLVALFVGLFCGRWTLMALGEIDFGLYGLVGGLIFFFTLLNSVFAAATSRFFAVAIGEARISSDQAAGLENCRRWFNVAFVIHTIFPTLILLVGYPVGAWFVRHWLVIPPDRIESCIWVFRFACLAGYALMVSVPFFALYVAKQYIAEVTIFSFGQSIAHFGFAAYMIAHPGAWLTRYAAWMCFLEVAVAFSYCLRAFFVFPECRLNWTYWKQWRCFREMCQYAFWQFFSSFGQMFSGQGLQILVNKYFGAGINASMAVGNKVLAHATALTGSTGTAFQPVIASAYGAGEMDRVRAFAFRTTKLALVFALVFVMPLCLEMDLVLVLWLKDPPPAAAFLCTCVLLAYLGDKLGFGEALAIEASGKVAIYQFIYGCCQVLVLLVAWGFAAHGFGVKSIGVGLLVGMTLGGFVRVVLAAKLISMPLWRWFSRMALPVFASAAVAFGVGALVRAHLPADVMRILLTTIAFEFVFMPLVWFFLLDPYEREYLLGKVLKVVRRGNAL